MCKKKNQTNWGQVKSGEDAVNYACNYGAELDRQTGSHMIVKKVVKTSNKISKVIAVIPNNPSLPAGTKCSIKRQLIAMGIPIVMVVFIFVYFVYIA